MNYNTDEFIEAVNMLRKENKNKWYYFKGIVNNKQVILKGYNTYIQRIKIDNITDGSACDMSVKSFKDYLNSRVN